MAFLTHLVAIAFGALLTWWLLRGRDTAKAGSDTPAPTTSGTPPDKMLAEDPELDARIIEFISSNRVFHINDVCQRIEHPKGSRFVRAHFHRLMDLGHIRYREMRYQV